MHLNVHHANSMQASGSHARPRMFLLEPMQIMEDIIV